MIGRMKFIGDSCSYPLAWHSPEIPDDRGGTERPGGGSLSSESSRSQAFLSVSRGGADHPQCRDKQGVPNTGGWGY
jgi:hypothetical protein